MCARYQYIGLGGISRCCVPGNLESENLPPLKTLAQVEHLSYVRMSLCKRRKLVQSIVIAMILSVGKLSLYSLIAGLGSAIPGAEGFSREEPAHRRRKLGCGKKPFNPVSALPVLLIYV
jgi:hypothetical protein